MEAIKEGVSTYTTKSHASQNAQIDMGIKLRRFGSDIVPWLVEKGDMTGQPSPPAPHVLDYNNVLALVERLTLYLSYKVAMTQARSSTGSVVKSMLCSWRRNVLNALIYYIMTKETLETVTATMHRVLAHSAKGDNSVNVQLYRHTAYLARHYNLADKAKEEGASHARSGAGSMVKSSCAARSRMCWMP
ncbi:uncharacterized protein PSFLO_01263 [Pseudozyma flocculosa]|uniref:Uncharacterized protein n=1 Tax=Pseudozyma flocculosa TaxID=84751 RepID=A0A5C3EUS6_9BASI|nr:uncharacterized protein PSFLO_01263 [Pseudozyma flocculosa]